MRAGASPSQNGMLGAAPCASSTRTRPALHAANAPGGIAQQNDVAAQALHRKVLGDGAHRGAFRLRDDGVERSCRESRRRW